MSTMNIYASRGTKVRYTGENGYDHEHIDIQTMGVSVGDILTVERTEVGSWKTYVYFEELDGGYNSVMFEDVK